MFRLLFIIAMVLLSVLGCSTLELDAQDSDRKEASAHADFFEFKFSGELYTTSTFNPEKSIERQILYSVGQFNGERAIGRLDRLEIFDVNVEAENEGHLIRYSARLPVAWDKSGRNPEDYEIILPRDLTYDGEKIFTDKYKDTCVSPGAHDVTTGSMWYYWRPLATRCQFEDVDVVRMVAQVEPSTLQTSGKYPEYQKVWEDGRLEVVAIFGMADYEGDRNSDIGAKNLERFISRLMSELGGSVTRTVPEVLPSNPGFGHNEIEIVAELDETHEVLVRLLMVENPREAGWDFETRYAELTPTADLIIYNGHSGLGRNIRALSQKAVWQAGQYVVFFMNGCDTYAYVEASLFDAHRDLNPDDPFGTRYVDLVVNAMPAYFYLMPRAAYAVFDGLLKYDDPVTYEAMFEDVDESQLVLVVGEGDNTFEPGLIE